MLTDRVRVLSFRDNSTVRSFSFIAYSVANFAFLAFTLRMPVKSNPRENFHLYQFAATSPAFLRCESGWPPEAAESSEADPKSCFERQNFPERVRATAILCLVLPSEIAGGQFGRSSLTRCPCDLCFQGLLVLGSNEQAWRQGLDRNPKRGLAAFFMRQHY